MYQPLIPEHERALAETFFTAVFMSQGKRHSTLNLMIYLYMRQEQKLPRLDSSAIAIEIFNYLFNRPDKANASIHYFELPPEDIPQFYEDFYSLFSQAIHICFAMLDYAKLINIDNIMTDYEGTLAAFSADRPISLMEKLAPINITAILFRLIIYFYLKKDFSQALQYCEQLHKLLTEKIKGIPGKKVGGELILDYLPDFLTGDISTIQMSLIKFKQVVTNINKQVRPPTQLLILLGELEYSSFVNACTWAQAHKSISAVQTT